MNLKEETLSSETLYKGRILTLKRDSVRLPDGSESIREIVDNRGAVAVVAVDDDDNILLVNQFRYPSQAVITEIPAGKLEENEEPQVCAIRELEEETGYTAKTLIPMGSSLPSPGYAKEEVFLYYACDLKFVGQRLDEGEFLNVIKMPFEDAFALTADNTYHDGKTQVGILKAKLLREKGLHK